MSTALQQAKAAVASQLGLSGFDQLDDGAQNVAYQNLSQADQVRFTDALSGYIYTNQDGFSTDQVTLARDRVKSPNYNTPLADTSFTAAASDFFSNTLDNVANFGQGIEKAIYVGVAIGIVGLVAYLAVLAHRSKLGTQ